MIRAKFFNLLRVPPARSTYLVATWLFYRMLGVIYAVAFISIGSQILGLIGSGGILPAGEFLDHAARHLGPERYWRLPTLFWVNAGDAAFLGACVAGAVLSLALIMGALPLGALVGLWVLYLSISTVGNVFLSFQWDTLLLEIGFLSIFGSSACLWDRKPRSEAPRMVRWLMWWLLFRLMFTSGIVKLASGDPTWRDLDALTFHYQTQPLPNIIGWYFHQSPVWIQKISCFITLMIELAAPFLIAAPRRARHPAAVVFIGFQCLILLTGNYGFFNWLSIALCIMLMDDMFWQKLRVFKRIDAPPREEGGKWVWPQWVIVPMFAMIFLVTLQGMLDRSVRGIPRPRPLGEFSQIIRPFRTLNAYGLFAVMTTRRPEIVIEGSRDGKSWHEYEFKFKPGNLSEPPKWAAPHQPRLDWQMWFAALGRCQENPWFIHFLKRLVKEEPAVMALIKDNPFKGSPPAYLRAVLYDYQFTNFETRRKTDHWWQRKRIGLYCPVLSSDGSF